MLQVRLKTLFFAAILFFAPLLNWAQTNLDIEVVFVKGGTFTMGCTREQIGCEDDERPAHKVTLSDYYIGKYEVTQAQYKAVMGNNPSEFSGCDDCPVENVSWYDAKEFCRKLSQLTGKNYRLPTEAQWEYAARGGEKSQGYLYAGVDDISKVAWYVENNSTKPKTVGSKLSNELGLYDMCGNVYEWCFDIYDEYYYNKSPEKDPDGPLEAGKYVVIRGGSWGSNAGYCRVARRSGFTPSSHDDNNGFRVVLIP